MNIRYSWDPHELHYSVSSYIIFWIKLSWQDLNPVIMYVPTFITVDVHVLAWSLSGPTESYFPRPELRWNWVAMELTYVRRANVGHESKAGQLPLRKEPSRGGVGIMKSITDSSHSLFISLLKTWKKAKNEKRLERIRNLKQNSIYYMILLSLGLKSFWARSWWSSNWGKSKNWKTCKVLHWIDLCNNLKLRGWRHGILSPRCTCIFSYLHNSRTFSSISLCSLGMWRSRKVPCCLSVCHFQICKYQQFNDSLLCEILSYFKW